MRCIYKIILTFIDKFIFLYYYTFGGDNLKIALVDYRIDEIEKINLSKLNLEVIKCPPCNELYYAINGHPDILVNFIDKKTLLVHKKIDTSFIELLKKYDFNIIFSEKTLERNYPEDIFLNAVNLKELFIHNLAYTDKSLLNSIHNKRLINVKQGYTKCSTAVVSDYAIITNDKGIATSLINENLDILLLPPGDILLPGLDYGFLGGTCGLLDDRHLAFYGSLEYYLYGEEVLNFLKNHNVEPIYLREGKLVDRGSLFIIDR